MCHLHFVLYVVLLFVGWNVVLIISCTLGVLYDTYAVFSLLIYHNIFISKLNSKGKTGHLMVCPHLNHFIVVVGSL